jgi:hypothetical protein
MLIFCNVEITDEDNLSWTTFASQGDDAAVCKAIAAALNSVDGADTFGRPFDEFDIMLVEDED